MMRQTYTLIIQWVPLLKYTKSLPNNNEGRDGQQGFTTPLAQECFSKSANE